MSSTTERANEWLQSAHVPASVEALAGDNSPEAMHLLNAVRAAVRAESRIVNKAADVRRETDELVSRLDKPSQIVNSLGEVQQAASLNAACGVYSAASDAFEYSAALFNSRQERGGF